MAERDDKKNTDLWKQKQEEKKRKKEAEAQGQGQPSKADKKKDKKKDQKKEEEKQQQKAKISKENNKNPKLQEKPQAPLASQSEAKHANEPTTQLNTTPMFKKLIKIDGLLSSKDRASRIYQQQLITKYMDQYLSDNDIVLYVGQNCRVKQHQQVYVKGLNNCSDAEMVCRYSDISYFLESSITKIFIEAEYVFSNGSILAKEGALSVALMANYYSIPVIAVGGSWTYNGWAPVNFEALEEKYGCQALKKLDWIQDKYLRSAIAEVGVINPRQVSIYPGIIYKQLELLSVEW